MTDQPNTETDADFVERWLRSDYYGPDGSALSIVERGKERERIAALARRADALAPAGDVKQRAMCDAELQARREIIGWNEIAGMWQCRAEKAEAALSARPFGAPMSAPWRVGSHYGIHVYEGEVPIATFVGPEDFAKANAASLVADHNARLDAEPVGWRIWDGGSWFLVDSVCGYRHRRHEPLYTHPPDAANLATVTAERDEAIAEAAEMTSVLSKREDVETFFSDTIKPLRARVAAAEAALAKAKRDAWIAGRDAAADHVDNPTNAYEVRALIPPAEAEGGRQDG